jgi:hypothetical protein
MPRFRVSFEVHLDVEAADVEEARVVVAQGIDDLSAADMLARTDDDGDFEECPEARALADALNELAADDGAALRVAELAQDGAA